MWFGFREARRLVVVSLLILLECIIVPCDGWLFKQRNNCVPFFCRGGGSQPPPPPRRTRSNKDPPPPRPPPRPPLPPQRHHAASAAVASHTKKPPPPPSSISKERITQLHQKGTLSLSTKQKEEPLETTQPTRPHPHSKNDPPPPPSVPALPQLSSKTKSTTREEIDRDKTHNHEGGVLAIYESIMAEQRSNDAEESTKNQNSELLNNAVHSNSLPKDMRKASMVDDIKHEEEMLDLYDSLLGKQDSKIVESTPATSQQGRDLGYYGRMNDAFRLEKLSLVTTTDVMSDRVVQEAEEQQRRPQRHVDIDIHPTLLDKDSMLSTYQTLLTYSQDVQSMANTQVDMGPDVLSDNEEDADKQEEEPMEEESQPVQTLDTLKQELQEEKKQPWEEIVSVRKKVHAMRKVPRCTILSSITDYTRNLTDEEFNTLLVDMSLPQMTDEEYSTYEYDEETMLHDGDTESDSLFLEKEQKSETVQVDSESGSAPHETSEHDSYSEYERQYDNDVNPFLAEEANFKPEECDNDLEYDDYENASDTESPIIVEWKGFSAAKETQSDEITDDADTSHQVHEKEKDPTVGNQLTDNRMMPQVHLVQDNDDPFRENSFLHEEPHPENRVADARDVASEYVEELCPAGMDDDKNTIQGPPLPETTPESRAFVNTMTEALPVGSKRATDGLSSQERLLNGGLDIASSTSIRNASSGSEKQELAAVPPPPITKQHTSTFVHHTPLDQSTYARAIDTAIPDKVGAVVNGEPGVNGVRTLERPPPPNTPTRDQPIHSTPLNSALDTVGASVRSETPLVGERNRAVERLRFPPTAKRRAQEGPNPPNIPPIHSTFLRDEPRPPHPPLPHVDSTAAVPPNIHIPSGSEHPVPPSYANLPPPPPLIPSQAGEEVQALGSDDSEDTEEALDESELRLLGEADLFDAEDVYSDEYDDMEDDSMDEDDWRILQLSQWTAPDKRDDEENDLYVLMEEQDDEYGVSSEDLTDMDDENIILKSAIDHQVEDTTSGDEEELMLLGDSAVEHLPQGLNLNHGMQPYPPPQPPPPPQDTIVAFGLPQQPPPQYYGDGWSSIPHHQQQQSVYAFGQNPAPPAQLQHPPNDDSHTQSRPPPPPN